MQSMVNNKNIKMLTSLDFAIHGEKLNFNKLDIFGFTINSLKMKVSITQSKTKKNWLQT